MRMALGHKKFTAFRTKFGLSECMVMPFGSTNTPVTCQQEMNKILRPLLGLELVVNSKEELDKDGGMVVVVYINNILLAMKASLQKHHRQVSEVFQLLMDNNMCVEINKCIFDATERPFLGFMVSGEGLRMDPDKAKAIVDWPRPTSQKDGQQLLGLWNFWRTFVPAVSAIISPISDLLRGDKKLFHWGEAHEVAFLKIMILFTSGKTPILWDYDPERLALLETDAFDFTIATVLSLKVEDN